MAVMKPKLNRHLLIFLVTLSLLSFHSAAEISLRELESAVFALRANGYNLFGNSIAVSDISFQVLSLRGGGAAGFTFLAPPNSALFSLDMAADAFSYVHSLRFHVVPRRFSFSDLRNLSLSVSPYLETLVPGHLLSVSSSGDLVSIDGVRVSFPDLYLRADIAAHGLDGILGSATEEHFHGLSPILMPPVDAYFSPAFDGIPAPSVQEFSISMPPAGPAYSPYFDRIPAPSPPELSIPPSDTALCGDWPGCDPDFFSPTFPPLPESLSLPPMDSVPESVFQSPETWKKSHCVGKKQHDNGDDKHEKDSAEESQNQGQGHYNFANYNHASLL